MKLDFAAAAKAHGIRSTIGGRGGISVFVDETVIRNHARREGPGVPIFPGDILTLPDGGEGILTRAGVETGVLIPLKGRHGVHEVPVTGTRSMLSTARRIAMGDFSGAAADTVARGISAAMRSIAFNPAPHNDLVSRIDAWRYVVGGPKGSNFSTLIDEDEFLMAIEAHVLRRRLFSSSLFQQPEASTGIESAFPGMMDMVQEFNAEALKVLMDDLNFRDIIGQISSAQCEDITIWQVMEGQEDVACATVEDSCNRIHDWSEVLTDAFRSVLGRAFPDHSYLARVASASDTDVAFVMADSGAMIITWPSITRHLIIPFRGLPHLTLSPFEVPSPDELREYVMEANAIPVQPQAEAEGVMDDHASAA